MPNSVESVELNSDMSEPNTPTDLKKMTRTTLSNNERQTMVSNIAKI